MSIKKKNSFINNMNCQNTLKYSNCPPRMDDGRHFTDYRSSCYSNSLFRHENELNCSHDYRTYLIKNATPLMKMNSEIAWKQNGCGPCKNLCLGIDETREGNSSQIDFSKCIPPKDYVRYNGAVPVSTPVIQRPVVPSGATLASSENSKFNSYPTHNM